MTNQEQVIEFLSSVGAYSSFEKGSDLQIQRRETHISIVFLIGQSAFKMKRCISYPYLDFSTLERRKYLCEQEVKINSRTAPDIYRGVVPVTRDKDGNLALGGEGEAVEWLVSMNRFADSSLWDQRALTGSLERRDFEVLADQVAAFHAAAESCDGSHAVSALGQSIDANEQSMAVHIGDLFDEEKVHDLYRRTREAYAILTPVLESRAASGCIRICHGDLHLGNIFTDENRPVLFDAIEFNEDFSHIDVLYDLAFLLMDVMYRVGKRRSTVLMNRYLDHTGDGVSVSLIPLLMSLRAAIRAHVSASAARQHADPGKQAELKEHAIRYFDLASQCLMPVKPRVIAVGGLSGSGKSRMARVIAGVLETAPGARVVRSDTVRKRLAGVGFEEHLPPDSYTPEASLKTYAACIKEALIILKAGYPVVLDAVFSKPEERDTAQSLASEAGVPFDGLWLEAPVSVMQERVESRRHNASDANAVVVEKQVSYDLGEIAWSRIDSSGEKENTEIDAFQILGLERDVL